MTLTVLDRSPDWREIVNRFDLLSRIMPMFRARIVASPSPAPPRWEADSGAVQDVDVLYDCLVAGFDDVLRLAR